MMNHRSCFRHLLLLGICLACLGVSRSLLAQLPEGWSSTDIGSPGQAGSAVLNAGVWTVRGGGGDIWGTSDQFQFVWCLSGSEGEIIAKVESQQETDSWAKSGVMFRDSTAPNAMFAMVVATPGNGVNFQWRAATGGECYYSQIAGLSPPYWVRLARSGDTFSAFWSLNGSTWTAIGPGQGISMSPIPLAGLCVTAHNDTLLCTTAFSNVSATNAPTTFGGAFGIYRELWTGLSSAAPTPMDALTNTLYNTNWPNRPVSQWTRVLPGIETAANTSMNEYGQRLRAFLVPPASGSYVFQIASDDSSVLYLSGDENASGMIPIARVNGWTNPREWTRESNQTSVPVYLEEGRRYYLEILMRQGFGGDNLAVRWIAPNGGVDEPIPAEGTNGTRLVPCSGVVSPPGVFSQTTNGTVVEGVALRLQVLSTNRSSIAYQWRVDGTNVTGSAGQQPVLVISNPVPALHQGRVYSCVLSNALGLATNNPVTLNVIPDTNAPTVVAAFNLSSNLVQLVFSELLSILTATNPANYQFVNGLGAGSAALTAEGQSVWLTVGPLVFGSNYTILLTNLCDRASASNQIAAGTQVTFQAAPFAVLDVGSPATPSQAGQMSLSGLVLQAGGTGIGGNADQFGFACQLAAGDFDLRGRVAGISAADAWAKGGLMARETLNPRSRFAAVLGSAALQGPDFEWRDPEAAGVQNSGAFPLNYPNSWIRLKRAGNVFSGYAGYDGTNWTQLGSVTIAMASQVYLGWALSGQNASHPAVATFADQGPAAGAVLVSVPNPYDPPGPSSRKTPIAITEIMYKPADRADTNNLEFVELYNSNPWFQDLSGYRLVADSLDYTFPSGTRLEGGAFLVVAASPGSLSQVYGITNVAGPYSGSLKNSGTVKLLDERGSELLVVPYAAEPPWPAGADGAGHSLVLAHPSYGEGDPRAWEISDIVGGSPGQMEAYRPNPLRNVVINEILAHTDLPDWDYIELYNHSTQAVSIAGCVLTDNAATNKFVVPPGTVIPARGFAVFFETNLNFALSATGETIYFWNPDRTRALDALCFGAQENGVGFGRSPDGARDYYRLEAKTPGTNNAAIRLESVVINEIMYNPAQRDDDLQYVELYNRGTNLVNLQAWQLQGGISYTFPANARLGPGGFLVVARSAATLRPNYANLNDTNCLGDFKGRLAHGGDRIILTMPHEIVSTNTLGVRITNYMQVAVNDVAYETGGAWGQWSDGGGSSLELVDPEANNRLGANWADSDETQKSAWTNLETTAVLDYGNNYGTNILYGQLGLLDAGECLVDEVEVRSGTSGANLVLNPGFETDLSNWWLQGNHSRSTLESSGGYLSSRSLHVRSSGRMWTGDNSCQFALQDNTLQEGQVATLRLKARWLRGAREILLRLNGNWLDVAGPMDIPRNLGTPGARNSRALTAAPPAIYEVTHSPALPAAYQPVIVTARLHSRVGLRSAYLYYRVDPASSYTAVPLRDSGVGGDAVANDGLFSATIPGQAAGTMVAFYLDASDVQFNVSRYPAALSDNRPVRECLVRFGDPEPAGSFGVYRFWISQANTARWSQMSDLSNEMYDGTFVYGRRVIYNLEGRYAGSPYHQGFDSPDGGLCHYKWVFPKDNKFLGAFSFNKLHQPGNGPGDDPSLQREQLANTLLRHLGVPWVNRRYVVAYVNGNRRGSLMEDAQTPDDDMVEEVFPQDAHGWLYKMQPWFEFGPFLSGSAIPFNNVSWCNLMPYLTTGGTKKTARYRYTFLVRQTPQLENDYTNVFSLIDAASSYGTPNYAANMQNLADMENWMRVFAANHAAGNWDAFGAQNAQNLYGYMGTEGTRYSLLMFDFNIVFGNGSWGPGQGLFAVNGQDPNTGNIYNEPAFRRMYWRALEELVNGPLDVARSGPLLDAKYRAFLANGLQVENPNYAIKSWLASARESIAGQLAAENATGFSVNGSVALSNNLAILTGNAPVSIATILVNGLLRPVTWTGVGAWRIEVPLSYGSNYLSVVGVDKNGAPSPGASNAVSVVSNVSVPGAAGQVVISEIMFNPVIQGADYVELYNTSSNYSFDLSGCEFRGLDYSFPAGAFIRPGQCLVLAANRALFAAAYGATTPVFDTYSGALQNNGETLTLLKPGTGGAGDTVIAKVKYGAEAPWPIPPVGSSLQLVDPAQDNWRIGNWNAADPSPKWLYVSSNIVATSSVLYLYLGSSGDIYVDDVALVGAEGTNMVANGDFEAPLAGTWNLTTYFSQSSLSTEIKHSGNSSLHLVATAAGSGNGNAVYQAITPGLVNSQVYTLSFWYRQSTNGGPLTLRLSNGTRTTVNPAPPTGAVAPATPGGPNSVAARLVAFPTLWLNEAEAENLTGITNNTGQRAPWIELFNPGSNSVSLQGLYLANNCSNLAQWAFPAGASIAPRQFQLVFADGQAQLSRSNELHANFALSPGSGRIVLSRLGTNAQLQVLDLLAYANLRADHSFGSVPDAQSFQQRELFYPTPGATNNGASLPLTVFINEWMADNTSTLADPADNKFQDWFELYNAGSLPVDLGNFYLTDTLTNKFKFQIPATGRYVIPSGGFLLVWADEDTGQNSTNTADLHVNFKLDKLGEAIGLFGADGAAVDYVTFGPQTNDVSMGRIPDGGTAMGVLPVPTPRTTNAVPNTAPVLQPIPDYYVYVGHLLRLAVQATDAQAPPQTLGYALEPGAPAAATIDGAGWLSWAPSAADVGTNFLTVTAQDNGVPPMSASTAFRVMVLAAPAVSTVVVAADSLRLSWMGYPGQTYRLESAEDLSGVGWAPASPDIEGAGGTLSLDLVITPTGNRFYRLVVLP